MTDIRDNSPHLVAILADMVRSALTWEDEHCNAVTSADSDERGLDCMAGEYTLFPHNSTAQPQEAPGEGAHDDNHE